MLNEKIANDLKQAMIAKDAFTLSVLRMLKTAIKNKMIALGDGGKNELADEQIVEIVSAEIKKRKDSIEAFLSGGRQDLADKEKTEIEVLAKYQPEQMSEEELRKIITETISALGQVTANDFGKIMGALMPKVKGKADGNLVNKIVKEILAK
ncbi:MAG: hypothetical protein US83_C0003G0062 [Candidatus Falkowbacteria bacterium GW2011_GWC2_38_22]|uniref:GatB/YqeY domain-containing protein n=1 Tax=Candidatus Falkowbacteria bacterium GW2011_GWE1_38_31 TaxID=1618638 RepID=A0A0G0JXC7_9BACT|nr:MAG: hypothetical protein US73_C0001G0154 [Candidatus Falkowbacteria bacterium GW2011_GWF2_38_1205]KKQ61813.1 MAG: hypothetical protein US83_C0003G0062 [Candidatus Falkowbacteria bacterium GW2011_GWC2_38_22]KKQ64121.1 MAG: hypothetical protein US84_C0002G0153 [Candidatus Falkowbacteria bacterium GW2011_GWF1_38_22]KKQ66529.1 MAG: hypothetical protein US87_C0001G0050 [Candidatus Falkowbacteria bacterium GW2011_GWE2_38_254]KKQ71227.1 MAG: hypothetical protein US91_C0001G0154 [Candidatus Falkowb